jgi:hypothetical protein
MLIPGPAAQTSAAARYRRHSLPVSLRSSLLPAAARPIAVPSLSGEHVWQRCSPAQIQSVGTTIFLESIVASFTDLAQADRLNRNLFFSGVLAGVLGALAIEIFNGTFDVLEARRRTRRDEEDQRPDPTPEPPPSEPDDEVDRDQLRLF